MANSESLDQRGYFKCKSCRCDFPVSDSVVCERCDRFVCSSCATYRRQGEPYGYFCVSCYNELDD